MSLSVTSIFSWLIKVPSAMELHFLLPTCTPILRTCVTNFSMKKCSACNGHAVAKGTPAKNPSKAEFHQQCVTRY
ncbi:hypothetical protein RND81_06G102100 [Saponaria officinalis]|uniref:Uncharacterized protein n=1 Tax=Saponaria officinalis TaxID=3572 RepID=A0AAW1K875_SAPOF